MPVRAKQTFYNDKQYTDTPSLDNAIMESPHKLSGAMTQLGGQFSRHFLMHFITEGIGNVETTTKDTVELDVQTPPRVTRPVAKTPANTTDAGLNNQPFKLSFPDRWFIKGYILTSPSNYQAQITGNPVKAGDNWEYTLTPVDGTGSASVPVEDLQQGAKWASMFAPVSKDFSRGLASNWEAPGKLKHFLSTLRKSYSISGNVHNKVMEFTFTFADGSTTQRWLSFEEWQYFLQWKKEMELWVTYGIQSYDVDGVTKLVDGNGRPVTIGPGVLEQIVHTDSFSILTAKKLDNIFGSLFFGMSDAEAVNVVLQTGTGGTRDFDNAMKERLGNHNFTILDQGKFVTEKNGSLNLKGFFKSYEHVDGHTITVVKNPIYDRGAVAQASRKHPISGLPIESHRLTFLDQSSYDGNSNLVMVNKKNREMLKWSVSGSTQPEGHPATAERASDVDGYSVHYLKQGLIVLRRNDTSIDIPCVLS